MDTKSVNLTKSEVINLLISTGQQLGWPDANFNDLMERLNYLHKRLKAFSEVETKTMPAPTTQASAWPSN